MEWVETTGKTIDEARDRALDQLGVADDDAEIEVLEEPRAGLFGLIRGEARVRARVRPAEVRPKQDRRRGRKSDKARNGDEDSGIGAELPGGAVAAGAVATTSVRDRAADDDRSDDVPDDVSDRFDDDGSDRADDVSESDDAPVERAAQPSRARRGHDDRSDGDGRAGRGRPARDGAREREGRDDEDRAPVDPAEVGAAAVAFMEGLVEAFELDATVELIADGIDLEVHVHGNELGLMIGPGGRTLAAIQDLARVASQRRLGDHDTRLRIDVAGYRVRRREALERFARSVAQQVLETGTPRSMEPMPSADRKVIHDVLTDIDGVSSRSEGDDPDRRVVVVPA